jgi:2-amino-4-hydroxy-6-hydroxymethyldihydropteridine diphosphokinase
MIGVALARLQDALNVTAVSGLYSSEAMYMVHQPDFINAACLVDVTLGPRSFIRLIKSIETQLGRRPRERNGPREIDIDLITYGSLRLTSNVPPLEIPHPRAGERLFVLDPLYEIAPKLHLPGLGTVESLRENPALQTQVLHRIRDAQISILRD